MKSNMQPSSNRGLEDIHINVKAKISALWAAMMFLYIYVDFFSLYKPGTLEEIQAGRVWEFEITPTWVFFSLILMTIPSLMIFLSLILPAGINRWTNIILGILYILISLGNVLGESWSYYYLGAITEAVLLALVVFYAWRWPRVDAIQ